MAMIDYGASLKVNGVIVNHNMFMETSDAGYMVEQALYTDWEHINRPMQIKGQFFVYAGDQDLMLVFYKLQFFVISNGKVIANRFAPKLESETFYANGIPITVELIDKEMKHSARGIRLSKFKRCKSSAMWDTINNTFVEIKHHKGGYTAERTVKYYCHWDYKGKHYEVVYGYGIDETKGGYEECKYRYEYTDKEREFMDKWY